MEKYFLGSNTHSGFVGFYEEITDNIGRVYLLKGGAGTGKSSLIRKVIKRGIDLGFCCEGWHCSGDPRSLDGVYIKGLDVAVIDATSPHAIEPKIPAVKDDIVNLLEYVEKGKLCKHKDVIEKLSKSRSSPPRWTANGTQAYFKAWAHIAVHVVLPWLPATAITRENSLQISASKSAREMSVLPLDFA